MHFYYDEIGPSAVTYNGTNYYYLRNAQGDITGIVDTSKNIKVSYTYDAWGKQLSKTGDLASTLGTVNPFRYRGYVFDEETGLYYLKSRYYNPEWGRFINADSYLNTGQGLLGSNMFVYCNNNPAKCYDSEGKDAILLYDKSFPGHIGALLEDCEGNWWHFYWGTSKDISRFLCIFMYVEPYTWCVSYSGELTVDDINESKQYNGEYEDMLYLEGDFSKSIRSAQKPIGDYNLFQNNCSQTTLTIMAKSETIYKSILDGASKKVLPSNAYKSIKNNVSQKQCFGIARRNYNYCYAMLK